jgi:hypothetical protein
LTTIAKNHDLRRSTEHWGSWGFIRAADAQQLDVKEGVILAIPAPNFAHGGNELSAELRKLITGLFSILPPA